ncbi:MAG TPA: FMN-binding negative transcriptional regulator [Methylomirabilota bacterium]|nr:FMN-binding negative transcriptional regulator [Methylomirabilota bacterium]
MYVPKPFEVADPAWCHALIRAESFGTLVGVDEAGAPFATHLPFLVDESRGPLGTLLGHVARANPHWRYFKPGAPVLAVFAGPHAYVSPSWYEVHPAVPTWNYVAVHAYGVPALVEEPARARALLARLVRAHEDGRPDPWAFASLPEDYLAAMLKGIVAFEIPIDRLEGKAKLSQNRTTADRARVRAALEAAGDPLSAAVAAFMADRP